MVFEVGTEALQAWPENIVNPELSAADVTFIDMNDWHPTDDCRVGIGKRVRLHYYLEMSGQFSDVSI